MAEQHFAAHMHVGDGRTHAESDGESNAGPDAEPDVHADSGSDTRADACADAAPVRRRLARLRYDGGRHLLRDGTDHPHLRLQGRLLGEQQR